MRTKLIPGGIAAIGSLLFFFIPTVVTAEPQVLHGHVPTVVKSLSPIAPYPVTNHLNLAIALPLRNPAALSNLLQEIYDPASPKFHHYLTPEEFTAQFGPTRAAYEAVITFATAHGLRVTATHPNRMLLDVSGSVADIERAFHVTLRTYRHPTEPRTFYAPDTEPSVNLAVPILQVVGLDNYARPHPAYKIRAQTGPGQVVASGSGPGGNYMGYDFRNAYAPGVSLNGAGQTVALFEMDGYSPGDILYYENTNGLPSVTLTNVLLGGATGIPSDPGAVVEVSLDIEMAISMAPQLSRVMVYEAPLTSVGAYDILNQIATDDQAAQISSSWVIDRIVTDPVPDAIYLEYAAQGQSFFQASGDQDAYVPGTFQTADNSFITTVGGTTLTTTGSGGAYMSEVVWQWGGGTGSGGGISTVFAIPTYQQGIDMTTNQGSTTMRNVPDVALTADQVYVRANGTDYVGVGGTSCAAPLWAGFMALVNQQAAAFGRPAAGFINPAVYALAQTPNYTNYFHDIVVGNNTNISSHNLFFAVPGYDLCTGWGTPAGQALIDALAIPDALVITPTAGFSSSGGRGGPFTITTQSLILTNAGTNALSWSLVNTSPWLDASPTGGSLIPGGPTTNVIVNLNSVASNLVAGTYTSTLWFTNLTSGAGQSRTFTLTVLGAPVITSQPVNQTVLAGFTANFTVGILGLPPLAYQWYFGDAILPLGTNATLTLPNVTTNQAGNYFVVVTNSLGSVTSSVVTLTVEPGPVFLTGNYLYLPVQTNGVFLANNTGGKFNPAGTGGASGVDFWEPGTPVYNTAVGVGGIAYVNGSAPVVSGFSSISVNNLSSGDTQEALISGVVKSGLNFSRDISFGVNSKVIRIVDTLQNTGPVPLTSVVTLDTADPDQDSLSHSTFSTLNDVVSVNQTNDLVVATGPDTGLSVGLGSDSGLQIPSAVGFNNLNPYTLTNVVDPGGVLADIDINLVQNYGTLGAGQSQSVVWYIVFGASKAEVLTNFALASQPNALQITPSTGFSSSGGVGGPFTVTSQSLTLTNAGTNTLAWSLVNSSPWLDASPTGGSLVPGGPATNVIVNLNSVASNLVVGTYTATLWFTNLTSGLGQGRNYALTVLGAPVITNQPVSQTVLAGSPVNFTVGVLGLPPLYYQWFFDDTNLPSATNATLTLSNVSTNQVGDYYAVVSNSLGSATSAVAVLTLTTKLQASAVVYLRSTIGEPWGKADNDGILTMVFGSGWQDLRYETVNPAALFSPTNRLIFMEGSDNNALAMGAFLTNNLPAISNWVYAGGSLFVNAAPNQGANQYLGFGVTLIYPDFTSTAGASDPLHPIFAGPFTPVGLTWTGDYFGHAAVTGAGLTSLITNASNGNIVLAEKNYGFGHLLFGGMTLPSFHSPQPQGSNLLANIFSYAGGQFRVGTNLPPIITSQPVGVTVPAGSNATFSVTAIGSPPLNYLWWRNGAPIPAATNWSYTLTNAQISDSGSQFSCVITNPVNSVTSSVALLKVVTLVANDECSGAVVITGLNYTNTQSTTSATSAGDPVPGCIPGFGNGVWYQFTPAFNGQLEVDTFGSDFDTGLALYTGGCGALTEVACNDDTSGLQSQIIVPVSAGTSYYILAGGYSGYTGHLVIHLALTVPMTVDHFGWSAITSPQGVNAPFAAMIAAKNVANLTVTSFNGSVGLSALIAGQTTNRMFDGVTASRSNTGTYTWGYLFTPTTNLLVTHVRSYYGSKVSVWTGGGVLLAAQSVTGPAGAWTETALASPLVLSAGSNYVVAAYCSHTNYYWVTSLAGAFADGTVGASLYSTTDSFPISPDSGAWPLVGLRYTVAASQPVPIAPTTAGPFTNGVWGGNIAVLHAAANVVLLASDGNGHTGSSNPFQVVFLVIRRVVVLPDGSIQLTLDGSLGDTVRVLGSTNLVDWQTVATLTNLTGTVQFTDPLATNYSQRFYRCVTP